MHFADLALPADTPALEAPGHALTSSLEITSFNDSAFSTISEQSTGRISVAYLSLQERILQHDRQLSGTASKCLLLFCVFIMSTLVVLSSVSKCILISSVSIILCMVIPILIFAGWKRGRILNSTKSCLFDRTVHKSIFVLSVSAIAWACLIVKGEACLDTWALVVYYTLLSIFTMPPVLFAFYKIKDMKTYVKDRSERIRKLCELVITQKSILEDDVNLREDLDFIFMGLKHEKQISPFIQSNRCLVSDVIDPMQYSQAHRNKQPCDITEALDIHRQNLGEEYNRQFTLTSNPSNDYEFSFRLIPLDVFVGDTFQEISVCTPHPMFAEHDELENAFCNLVMKALPSIQQIPDMPDLTNQVLQLYFRARSINFTENRSYVGGLDPQLPGEICAVANYFLRIDSERPHTTLQVGLVPEEGTSSANDSHMIVPILLDQDEYFLESLKCHDIEEDLLSVCCGQRTLHRVSHKKEADPDANLFMLSIFLQDPFVSVNSFSYFALNQFLKQKPWKLPIDIIHLIAIYLGCTPNTFTSYYEGDPHELSHFIRFSRGLPNESVQICENKHREKVRLACQFLHPDDLPSPYFGIQSSQDTLTGI